MPGLNHNVKACILLCVLSGIADSTWSGTVIAAFILIASGSNTTVGLIEAAQGLATLLFALPIGYLADKYGRSGVISTGGVLCICAAIATTYVILDVERDSQMSAHSIGVLFTVMVVWGVVGGIISGPSQALYADSIPTGERSKWYVYLFGAYIISSAVGPILSICVFAVTEDEWTLAELRLVILCGMAAELGCALVMFTFSDAAALGHRSDAVVQAQPISERPPARASNAPAAAAEAPLRAPNAAVPCAAPAAAADEHAPSAAAERARVGPAGADAGAAPLVNDGGSPSAHAARGGAPPVPPLAPPAPRAPETRFGRIPYVLFASSLLTALGSGMTVKFFPLFFKQDCALSPEATQGIYVVVPFAMVGCSALVQRASATVGRIQCIVLSRACGVCLLLLMAWLQLRSTYRGAALVLVPVYVLRTALMNSGYPLEESILMDYVPKASRARWKSLESVSQFGWCGSAALGGWLGDRFGYSYTFLLTAAIQGSATLLVATLLPVVPRREADGAALIGDDDEEAEREAPSDGGEAGAEPSSPAPHAGAASVAARGSAAPAGARGAKPVRHNLPLALQEPLLDPTADE